MATTLREFIDPQIEAVCSAWKILGRFGLVDTIFNHISTVVADSSGALQMIMNPSGRLPEELCPDQVCVFPLREYLPSEADELGVNKDGLHLHSAMHSKRMKPGTIIHTHSPCCIAVGCSEKGLQPLSQTAMEFVSELELVSYGGVFRSQALTEQLSGLSLRGGSALLRHHGALVVADDVPEAVYLAYYLEEACRIQVLTLSQGSSVILPDRTAIESAHLGLKADRENESVRLFEALCRQLESRK